MNILVLKDRNVLNTKFVAQFVNDLTTFGHRVHLVCDSFRKAGTGVTLDPHIEFEVHLHPFATDLLGIAVIGTLDQLLVATFMLD